MSLIRWDPFADVDTLFDRAMPRLLGRWSRVARGADADGFEWSPSADVSETEKEYLIRAELPAVKKEDVKVTVDGDMISIQGERKQQLEDKTEKYHRVESFHGTFTRRFTLPNDADAKAIRCDNKDGILTIHIPKTQSSTSKPIQIKVE